MWFLFIRTLSMPLNFNANRIHTVITGDTLTSIANKYSINPNFISLICQENEIKDPNKINVGDEIEIPKVSASDEPPSLQTTDDSFNLNFDSLSLALGGDKVVAEKYLIPLQQCLTKFNINTPLRAAHFLAQIFHESNGLKSTIENLNYSMNGLKSTFSKYFTHSSELEAYARQPEKIANRVYANRMGNGNEKSGDGWKYRGRGVIQLTGKSNYSLFGEKMDYDFINNPELAKRPEISVIIAGWYWNKSNLNYHADNDDIVTITKRINGGENGLQDRIEIKERLKGLFCNH
jgi:putative chitinase